jgi:hypothetical protein
MRRHLFAVIVAIAGCTLSWSTAGAAPIVVDDFSTPTVSAAAVTSLPLTTNLGGGITRTITATGSFDAASTYQINTPVNTFTLNTATNQTITIQMKYDFSSSLSFPGNTTIEFNVLSYDLGPFDIKAVLLDSSNNVLYSQTITLPSPSPSPGSAFVSFGPFGPISGISSLVLTFNSGGRTDLDFRIGGDGGGIQFNDQVPEPGTLATFGMIGLVGGLALRRRLRQRMLA